MAKFLKLLFHNFTSFKLSTGFPLNFDSFDHRIIYCCFKMIIYWTEVKILYLTIDIWPWYWLKKAQKMFQKLVSQSIVNNYRARKRRRNDDSSSSDESDIAHPSQRSRNVWHPVEN